MTMRLRKLVGGLVLFAFVIVYAFFAMVLGDMLVRGASPFVQLAYFAVAGLIWVIPSALIVRFMQRPDS
jgi:hypothetical protein